jgi:hypothetical protein
MNAWPRGPKQSYSAVPSDALVANPQGLVFFARYDPPMTPVFLDATKHSWRLPEIQPPLKVWRGFSAHLPLLSFPYNCIQGYVLCGRDTGCCGVTEGASLPANLSGHQYRIVKPLWKAECHHSRRR